MIRNGMIGSIWILALALALGCEQQAGQELETEERKPGEMIGGEEPERGAPTAGETPTPQDQQQQQEQAEVLAIVQTANRGEIEAATYAQENASRQEVKDLAERIKNDHQEALDQESELISEMNVQPAMQAQQVQRLQQEQRTMMQELRSVSGADLDRKYVESQIQAHQQTLNDIDRRLMPMASGELSEHLRELRSTVQEHLTSLQELQPQLQAGQGQRQRQGEREGRPQGQTQQPPQGTR